MAPLPRFHPAINAAVANRPVLREALNRDGALGERLDLLTVFLRTLERHLPDQWLARRMVEDLLPSDRDLLDAHHQFERARREALMPRPITLSELGITEDDVQVGPGAVTAQQTFDGVRIADPVAMAAPQVTCYNPGPRHTAVHLQANDCTLPVIA